MRSSCTTTRNYCNIRPHMKRPQLSSYLRVKDWKFFPWDQELGKISALTTFFFSPNIVLEILARTLRPKTLRKKQTGKTAWHWTWQWFLGYGVKRTNYNNNEDIEKQGYIKLKRLCVKGQNQQNEKPAMEWEKTSVKSTLSEKGGLISRIYKDLLQINQK